MNIKEITVPHSYRNRFMKNYGTTTIVKNSSGGSGGGGGGGGSFEPHYLWGQYFDDTEDIEGDLVSNGTVRAQNINAQNGYVVNMEGVQANFEGVQGTRANFNQFIGSQANITGIQGTNLIYTNIRGTQGDFTRLNTQYLDVAVSAYIKELLSKDITTENLTVTKAAHFFKLVIDEIKASKGQIIVTPANATLDLVEEIKSGNTVTGWRCYFLANDGDKKLYNSFEASDQVICQTFDAATGVSYNVSNKFYWRLCTAASSTPVTKTINGEQVDCHYIDLSASDCDQYSNAVPEAGDEIVMLGHRTSNNKDRQAAIIISAYNNTYLDPEIKAPSIVQYYGINNYNLSTHRRNVISRDTNKFTGEFSVVSGNSTEDILNLIYSNTPYIQNGYWYINGESTGIAVTGEDDNTPYVGPNGNWWIGNVDTGYAAERPQGPQGPVGPQGASGISVTITNTSVQYQVSNSGTTTPTGTWQNNVPSADPGQFIWTRTIVTYSDGTSTTTYSVSRYGINGTDGTNGTSITITNTSVTYAVTNTNVQPADETFTYSSIPPLNPGQYLWSKQIVTYSDSTSIKSYSVSRIGTDGTNGQPGLDGKTTHWAYATDNHGTNFSTTMFNGATWVGTYSDTTLADSTDYNDYDWTPLKGDTGPQGAAGESVYVADLDNELDAVSCDETGHPVSTQSVSTNINLYYGSYKQTITTPTVKRNGTTLTLGTTSNGVTATYSNGTLTISYATAATISNKDLYEISFTKTGSGITWQLVFTVNGIRDDVYNLLNDVDAIRAIKGSNGNYTYDGTYVSYPLTCGYTKNVNGTITTVPTFIGDSNNNNQIDGKYQIFFAVRYRDTQTWQKWNGSIAGHDGDSLMYNRFYGANMTIGGTVHNASTVNVNTFDAVKFIISSGGANQTGGWAGNNIPIIDEAILPIIADGAQGEQGPQGATGQGVTITSTSVQYQVSNSGTVTPTGTWQNSVPSADPGQFIWTRTIVTYSDGTSTTTYSVSRDGKNGASGTTIDTTSVTYAVTDTNVQPADSSFTYNSIPPLNPGQYLWTKQVINYDDGTSIKSYSVSRIGTDGTNGQPGLNGKTTHWAYATNNSGANFSTTMFNGATWVGTYDDTNLADSTNWRDYTWTPLKGDTGPQGPQGNNGTSISITSTSVQYQVSNSGTTTPTGTWQNNVPSANPGQFIWTRTIVTYSDGTSTTTYSVSRYGTNGTDGTNGTSITITSTSVTYAVTNTSTQPADSAFTYSSIPALSPGQYLWTKQIVTYSDSTSIKSYTVSRIGADGTNGQPGLNGKTTHWAYATNNSGANFSTTMFNGATWVGTYDDTNLADSTNWRDYTWTQLKGDTGPQGPAGPTIWDVNAYKFGEIAGAKPSVTSNITTSTVDFGNGWKSTPQAPSYTGERISSATVNNTGLNSSSTAGNMTVWAAINSSDACYTGLTTNFGEGWKVAKGNGADSKYVVDRLYFTPKTNSARITLQIAVSTTKSESKYDGVLIGNVGVAATTSINWSSGAKTSTYDKTTVYTNSTFNAAGVYTFNITVSNKAETLTFIDVMYKKDGSSSYDLDCGYYRIVRSEGVNWVSTATVTNGTVGTGGWSDPIKWQGQDGIDGADGANGDPADYYELEPIVEQAKVIIKNGNTEYPEGTLYVNVSYNIIHVVGDTRTIITPNNTSGYHVRLSNSKGNPAATTGFTINNNTISYGNTTYQNPYHTDTNPIQWIKCEIVYGSSHTSVNANVRYVNVIFEAGAVLSVTDSISATVQGQQETINGISNNVSSLAVAVEGIQGTVTTINNNYVNQSQLTQTANSITSSITSDYRDAIVNGKTIEIDLTAQNEALFIPVGISFDTTKGKRPEGYNISIERTFDQTMGLTHYGIHKRVGGGTTDTPLVDGDGFEFNISWHTVGSGWGTNWGFVSPLDSNGWYQDEKNGDGKDLYRYITDYTLTYTKGCYYRLVGSTWEWKGYEGSYTPTSSDKLVPGTCICGSIRQDGMKSEELIYLRGGSKYKLHTDYFDAVVTKYTGRYNVTTGGRTAVMPIINPNSYNQIIMPVEDVMKRSEIVQTADNIGLHVIEGLKSTGIDIESGKIDLIADNTNVIGNLNLKRTDNGITLYDASGNARVNIIPQNTPTPTAGDNNFSSRNFISIGSDLVNKTATAQINVTTQKGVLGTFQSGQSIKMSIFPRLYGLLSSNYYMENNAASITCTAKLYLGNNTSAYNSTTRTLNRTTISNGMYEYHSFDWTVSNLSSSGTYKIEVTITANDSNPGYTEYRCYASIDYEKQVQSLTYLGLDGLLIGSSNQHFAKISKDAFEFRWIGLDGVDVYGGTAVRMSNNGFQRVYNFDIINGPLSWVAFDGYSKSTVLTSDNFTSRSFYSGNDYRSNKKSYIVQPNDVNIFIPQGFSLNDVWILLGDGVGGRESYNKIDGRKIVMRNFSGKSVYVCIGSASTGYHIMWRDNGDYQSYIELDNAGFTFMSIPSCWSGSNTCDWALMHKG